ncbi:Gp138 family membrane-puncturing spike protein [Marinobacter sp.]|uniref:Gp138 family membrane-puncturing spike protein n=1 Tax=Marinobacter sp. TaxID=50741 RepID=UPI000C979B8D|nr:Gp138 family membrane-puncturing spike protein [Marinobacter sp.]MAB53540.1 hypothetical protein [Marinobacter sp.]|tara:strand:- start:437 stop:1060 length:624 start_codon:yes stop_codon:yes gene_type:complete
MAEKKQLVDTITQAISVALANTHTATIGRVERVRETTIDVRPVINRNVNGRDVPLPLFVEVPPVFMQGGGSYTAHPIAVGDYCLLIFTERCFDRWYEGQDFQLPAEYRMHDYSDGLAFVGINPRAGALPIPEVIQQTGDTNQDGNYTRQGTLTQDGNMDITGDLSVDGDINCTGRITCANATIGGIDFLTHVHGGVDPGTGTSGVPV